MLTLVALEKLGQVSGNDRMTLIAWRVKLESFHAKAKVDSYLIAHCVVSNIVLMMCLLIIYAPNTALKKQTNKYYLFDNFLVHLVGSSLD